MLRIDEDVRGPRCRSRIARDGVRKGCIPNPDCDPLTDTQEACAVTAHAQSRAALIVSAPVPPLSPNWVGVADAVT